MISFDSEIVHAQPGYSNRNTAYHHDDHADHLGIFTSIEVRDWDTLDHLGFKIRSRSHLLMLQSMGTDINKERSFNAKMTFFDLVEGVQAMQETAEDPEYAAIDRLTKYEDTHSPLPTETRAALFGLMTNGEYREKHWALVRAKEEAVFLAMATPWAIGEAVTGYYSSFVARMNLYWPTITGKAVPTTMASLVRGRLAFLEQRSDQYLKQAQVAMAEGNREALGAVVHEALFDSERTLDELWSIVAWTHRLGQLAAEDTLAGQKAVGQLSLEVSHGVRRQMADYACMHWFMRLVGLPLWHPYWREPHKAADTLAFRSQVPDGRNVTIKAILDDPLAHEGDFVEVEGHITHLRTVKEPSDASPGYKMSSMVEIKEVRSEDVRIEVASPYANLTRAGLAEGTYCRLSGTVYQGADAHWRIRLDDLAYSELCDESFEDWLRKATNRQFPLWFQKKNIVAGYRPALDGDAGAGAEEILRMILGRAS